MNNKTLFVIFAALLGIYLLSKIFGGGDNKESNFDPNIVVIDTSVVDEIHLYPKAEEGDQIKLVKLNGKWGAEHNDLVVDATPNSVNSVLAQLTNIVAKRIVSKTPEKWTTYEVDDVNGSRVEVFSKGKKIDGFVVGSFKFDQAARSASSYMRKSDKDEVYIVDGFMSMQFNQRFDNFRNKVLSTLRSEDINGLELVDRESQKAFQRLEDGWYFAGMEQVDSAQIAQYLSALENMSGQEFIDDFVPTQSIPFQTLNVTANNQIGQTTFTAYENPGGEKPFVIKSSMNDAFFLSDSAGIYQRIFLKLGELVP